MKKEYIKSLDGVRGFAAILVLYGHTGGILGTSALSVVPVVAKSGVYLFFVLSAYLLGKQFMQSQISAETLNQNLSQYFFKRFARILPLYFFAITLHYAITLVIPGKSVLILDLSAYIKSLLLYKGYGHFWTIPVEFIFYFMLPAFALVGSKYENRYLALWGYSAFIFISIIGFDQFSDYGLIPLIFIFISGILIALIDVHWPAFSSGRYSSFYLILGIGGICAFFLAYPLFQDIYGFTYQEMENNRAFWALASSLVLSLALFGGRLGAIIFEFYPLRFVGMISFSAYIWHMLVYYAVEELSPFSITTNYLLAWSLTFLVGYFSYQLFEVKLYRSAILREMWTRSVGKWVH